MIDRDCERLQWHIPPSHTVYQHGRGATEQSFCNLCDYTLLYNHTDTLLLAETMMVYRKVIQDHFQMDINHFLRTPVLSFNIMLKSSKIKLEKISDPEINDFFQKI